MKCPRTDDCRPSNRDFGKMTHDGFCPVHVGSSLGCGRRAEPWAMLPGSDPLLRPAEVVAAQSGMLCLRRICLPLRLCLRVSHVCFQACFLLCSWQRTSKVPPFAGLTQDVPCIWPARPACPPRPGFTAVLPARI